MATGKTRKAPTKQKATKSGKAAKTKPPRRARSAAMMGDGPNYLLIGSDGKMVVRSGRTGEILDVDPALYPLIEELLQKRQQAGIELAQLLEDSGLTVASAIPVFIEP